MKKFILITAIITLSLIQTIAFATSNILGAVMIGNKGSETFNVTLKFGNSTPSILPCIIPNGEGSSCDQNGQDPVSVSVPPNQTFIYGLVIPAYGATIEVTCGVGSEWEDDFPIWISKAGMAIQAPPAWSSCAQVDGKNLLLLTPGS